jgi:hypothetical protein
MTGSGRYSSGRLVASAIFAVMILFSINLPAQTSNLEDVRAVAKEAYIYGNPMVDNYRIVYAYFLDTKDPEYKAPFNTLKNIPRVYTPEDKAVQSPNSDTPYSMLGMDLRTEPMVLTVPAIGKDRYFSIQLVDAYTANFDYIGSRTTGNDGGTFLVAGPRWNGETPKGIKKVFRAETEFALAIYRTQLFDPADLDNVKKIQAGYVAEPLSVFLGQPAAPAPAKAELVLPLSATEQKTSPEFFNILNFILQFCPTHPSENELMARFAMIGIGPEKTIDFKNLSAEMQKAYTDGIADAWKELEDFQKTSIDTGKVTSGDLFGTRDYLKNNYLYRFAAAVLGIYGNSKQEAMYPAYRVDADGRALDGSKNKYTLRFAPDQFPPVNAFWSMTMYDLPDSLLIENKLNRYLINSPMLPDLQLDADGGLTLYLQHDSPGAEKESNWLPAPNGPFWSAMRLYWPKEAALNAQWVPPQIERVK